QLSERRRWLATSAAQHRDQAVEGGLRMAVEGAQVNLLDLSAARTEDVEKIVLGGDSNADHRRPAGLVPRCAAFHYLVPLRHRFHSQCTVRSFGVGLSFAIF